MVDAEASALREDALKTLAQHFHCSTLYQQEKDTVTLGTWLLGLYGRRSLFPHGLCFDRRAGVRANVHPKQLIAFQGEESNSTRHEVFTLTTADPTRYLL